uniref:HECT-type E3 ubiquitin transferase n=1 Tax=Spongospora subterranea TaxID=70186 RepID=A0A0H5R4U6_9EUKA|eukprot:CRZ09173.1 hypothetical protein [Spongospora subterranea]
MASQDSHAQDNIKQRILEYHMMLSVGCGTKDCPNVNCASSNGFITLSNLDALRKAIVLLQNQAPVCLTHAATSTIASDINDECDPTGVIALMLSNKDAVPPRLSEVFENVSTICEYFPSRDSSQMAANMFKAILADDIVGTVFSDVLLPAVERIRLELSDSSEPPSEKPILAAWILLQNDFFLDPTSHNVLKQLMIGLASTSVSTRQTLISWFASNSQEDMSRVVGIVQSYISVTWALGPRLSDLAHATKFLGIIYEANELSTSPLPYTEFHNDLINSELDYRQDFAMFVQRPNEFCFSRHAYILDAAFKSNLLQLDASLQMRTQFDEAAMRFMFQSSSQVPSPFLVLEVNRDNIVADTLLQLQGKNSNDFKKPLKVKFVNEEGVDEGGVQKEFFQLLMRQLFNPAYGMFVFDEDCQMFWFNKDSFESKLEFELIGIMLGLAIYNSVILDIRFPLVVYKKLLNHTVKFSDMKTFNPALHKGLVQLLQFDGDVESVFTRTFSIEYSLFGEVKNVELCPGGSSIALTNQNRQEYVDLFVDYTFNSSVATQFHAFQSGFEMVCGGFWLQAFRPEELDLSICGSPVLDFYALEAAAKYENYNRSSPVIVNFWKVVHELSEEEKRKFLSFCTGSDRVPINGLGNLKVPFIIARNGPDSDRLPTSHTCFNHLLLPEYSTLEKLRERLITAIQNSEGFGLM